MTTKITEDNIEESTLNTISGGIKITSVISTNSEYAPLEVNESSTQTQININKQCFLTNKNSTI
jgi:hypothetical protein